MKKISAKDKAKKIRIALAQINTIVGDFKHNSQKIESSIRQAKKAGADIVLFPELTLTGYPPEDLLLKKDFIRENQEALKKLIPTATGITALVGYAEERISNTIFTTPWRSFLTASALAVTAR